MILERADPAAGGHFLRFHDRLGRPCAVWCLLRLPDGPGPHPVVIHCPGGTQTVQEADLAWWNAQGFACVSFDWQLGLYDHHDPARKSSWPPGVVMQGLPAADAGQLIIPLAVRAISAIIDWLERDPRLAADRVGITGISWGGYLTWVANAHEPRLRAAVPVYGCGGIFDPAHGCRARPHGAVRRAWLADWEPSRLAARQRSPVCWLSAADDFFGWPRHGDRLLDAVTVPTRRCHLPNADHAVDAGMSRLAVAWMRRWLRGGPALPPEPSSADAGEVWWTCSTGADDHACWWPGHVPAWATARLVRAHHGGITLSSRVERLVPRRTAPALPDRWPDIRAGLGWNWGLGTTQLHGNAGVGIETLPGDPTRGIVTGNRTGPLAVILRMTADPRWNRPGFSGMRVRLEAPVSQVTAQFRPQRPGSRPALTVRLAVEDGWIRLDRLPPGLTWAETTRIDLEGIPGPRFGLGPVLRI